MRWPEQVLEARSLRRSAAWRYGFTLLTVAAAVLTTWALQSLGLEHPPAPFLAAILLCGWYAGTGPVILAVTLSSLAFDYFFLPPLHSVDISPPNPYLLVFLPFAVLAAWFSAARQRSARLLEQSRSELEERVVARTAELERVNQDLRAEIAEHQITESQLRERTAQLDELFDQAPEAIALLDPQDLILRVNREFTRLFGYTPAEAVGRPIYELVVPPDQEEEARHLRVDFLWRGERIDLQTVRQRKDGSRVPVLLVGTSINVGGRPLAAYVMYRDITEEKRLEDELRRSEAYLVAGQRLSHTGSWARRIATGDIYWSEEAFRIFGLEPTKSTVREELVARLWHPDDRDRAEATIAAAIRDKRAFDMDVRIVRRDGSIRHVHTRGRPVLDESGEVVELMGVVMDVTDRKRAERALRRARERTMEARFAAVLDERTRLAREIHDTLLQGFTGVALQLLAATSRVTGPPEIIPTLRDLVTLAQKTLEDARRAVWDMRSPSLEGGDFATTLRSSAEESLQGTGLTLEFGTEGLPRRLDPEVAAVVLRVAQEAIANTVKHAQARQVRVGLVYGTGDVRLTVDDDGRGFAVEPDFHTYGGHWGLLGMRERTSQIQAKLSVRSTPGHGTEIVLLAPYTPRPQTRNTVRA
jgi:PAS domain S-box-containing protein